MYSIISCKYIYIYIYIMYSIISCKYMYIYIYILFGWMMISIDFIMNIKSYNLDMIE